MPPNETPNIDELFRSPHRHDGVDLEAGCYYRSRDGRAAKILDTSVVGFPEGWSCIGYWVHTGVEHQWLPDGGVSEVETDDDLIDKVDPEWVFKKCGKQLKPGHYYWTTYGNRVAKILATGVRRFCDDEPSDRDASFGEDPCIGYWLDTGEADAWWPRGHYLYYQPYLDKSSLDIASETKPRDIQWYLKRLDADLAIPMKYWIPKGVPYHLQIALSVPGREPWKSVSEHRLRMESQLLELARDWEYENGKGSALRVAEQEVPDSNVADFWDSASLAELVDALMYSDLTQTHFADEGVYDEEIQGACQESTFQDRLADLVRLA